MTFTGYLPAILSNGMLYLKAMIPNLKIFGIRLAKTARGKKLVKNT